MGGPVSARILPGRRLIPDIADAATALFANGELLALAALVEIHIECKQRLAIVPAQRHYRGAFRLLYDDGQTVAGFGQALIDVRLRHAVGTQRALDGITV